MREGCSNKAYSFWLGFLRILAAYDVTGARQSSDVSGGWRLTGTVTLEITGCCGIQTTGSPQPGAKRLTATVGSRSSLQSSSCGANHLVFSKVIQQFMRTIIKQLVSVFTCNSGNYSLYTLLQH